MSAYAQKVPKGPAAAAAAADQITIEGYDANG